MAGMGVGAGSLKILAGVLVHRAARPLVTRYEYTQGMNTDKV